VSLTPGSIFRSAAAALLMSMRSVFGEATVVFCDAGAIVDGAAVAFGALLVAGCAITGPAIVNARRPIGNRANLNIVNIAISYHRQQIAVGKITMHKLRIFHSITKIFPHTDLDIPGLIILIFSDSSRTIYPTSQNVLPVISRAIGV
jgi:hypothetical protein